MALVGPVKDRADVRLYPLAGLDCYSVLVQEGQSDVIVIAVIGLYRRAAEVRRAGREDAVLCGRAFVLAVINVAPPSAVFLVRPGDSVIASPDAKAGDGLGGVRRPRRRCKRQESQ